MPRCSRTFAAATVIPSSSAIASCERSYTSFNTTTLLSLGGKLVERERDAFERLGRLRHLRELLLVAVVGGLEIVGERLGLLAAPLVRGSTPRSR